MSRNVPLLLQYCSKVTTVLRDASRYSQMHWNTSLSSIFKPALSIIVSICTVDMIFILTSDACAPCVYYKNFFLCLQAGNFLQHDAKVPGTVEFVQHRHLP